MGDSKARNTRNRGDAVKKPREGKRTSDEVLVAKTGAPWAEWFKILDKAGAKKWQHKEISEYLYCKRKVSGWWSQMISVGNEHERGIRGKFQKCDGQFSASASRTIGVTLAKAYDAWVNKTLRSRWLPGAEMEITTATPGKSIRAKWDGGKSRLSVNFYGKGPSKTQVVADHMKLESSKEAAKMKAYWCEAFERMQRTFEG
jgi:hypothetical protein